MRILSGEARGRALKTREGKGTRPTDARAREMLFNILGERVLEARFLDLYAGTGAVGLEALSRGAARCVFVEGNSGAVQVIRANLKTLGWSERAQVWHATVKAALHRLVENGERFDLIFADPPFTRAGELDDLCRRLDNAAELLHNVAGQSDAGHGGWHGGLLVIQHHWKATPALPERFAARQQRRAGESMLSFFELKIEEA
jgi:16S rRNA (guanine966-N2)-methyltransferase